MDRLELGYAILRSINLDRVADMPLQNEAFAELVNNLFGLSAHRGEHLHARTLALLTMTTF